MCNSQRCQNMPGTSVLSWSVGRANSKGQASYFIPNAADVADQFKDIYRKETEKNSFLGNSRPDL